MAFILIILFLSFPETWKVIVDEVLQGGELVVAQVKACQFVCSNDAAWKKFNLLNLFEAGDQCCNEDWKWTEDEDEDSSVS